MRKSLIVLAALLAVAGAQQVQAQAFPNRPMRIIATVPPGSAPDVVARTVAQRLSANTGVPVTVDNRTGAGGLIGANTAGGAAPDGYTLLLADTGIFAILPHEHSSFDPLKSLIPVTSAGTTPLFLAVGAGLNASSVTELIAAAKAKPGMAYGSGGNGGAAHLFMELFKSLSGTDMTHVPYKGVAPAVAAVVAGEVVAVFSGLNLLVPQEKAGKLRIIAVASQTRTGLMPALPTVAEAGLPGFNIKTLTLGFFVPAGTPQDVVNKLRADLTAAVKAPDVRQRLNTLAVEEPTDFTQEYLTEIVRSELVQYGNLVKAANAAARK